ncbi:hypothetical protein D8674_028441 [Pyrus ussuriensis x Pyrus communis]|uniref:Uncharacterized protein n=1 Tax=Pyrus ussuriensis x Pyrus communis TaxID=2448454 RepID=A0A5N5I9N7_9ROSA|nr:hypothetical protein D8674_028441 [Pyrus ussuriensis x Pyrus communis]
MPSHHPTKGVAEASFVKICSINADCNSFPCTSGIVFYVNHICTCQVIVLVADRWGLLKCEDATLECV